MKRQSSGLLCALISACYLLPCITWIVLILWAAIPHLFFLYEGKAQETMSLFHLMGNTWDQARTALSGSDTPLNQQYFSYLTGGAVLLSWVCIIWYGIFAVMSAACSLYAFGLEPTSNLSNRAKRIFHLVCPNRVSFVLLNMLPLVPTLIPYIIPYCFEKFTLLGKMKPFYYGPADWLLATILILLTIAGFLSLLPAQRDEHRDLFRLYKAKKD